MSTVRRPDLISVDEYLAGELDSPIKHEYVAGVVYAMAGARNAHNIIATNITGFSLVRLRGKPCRPFNSDTKIRLRLATHTRFYYPDASVVCRPNPQDDSFQDDPVVIFEVLSQKTRRIDEGEKKEAYLKISSLGAYSLVEQAEPRIVTFRRTESGFAREVHVGLDAVLPLAEIGIELPLAEIYESIEFAPESDQDV